jgi:hypothetical protein
MKHFFISLFALTALFCVSCGGGGSSGGSGGSGGGGGDTVYTVSFYDGNDFLKEEAVISGTQINLPAPDDFPTLTKTGHTLSWLLEGTAELFNANDSYTVTKDAVFKVQWSLNKYTVSFYDNGVRLTRLSLTEDHGSEITLPSLASACFTFEGWQLDGAGEALTGTYKTVESDLRFDAKFSEPVKYISSPQDLYNIRDDLSGKYRLMKDISLSGYSSGSGWEPIGIYGDPFTGCLDGNGFKITDLYVDINGSGGIITAGLFGYMDGVISNIGVETESRGVNANYYLAGSYAGIIAAYVSGGSIIDSYAKGDVTATFVAGGLIGRMDDGSITGSFAIGSATASIHDSYAGGLVGYMEGSSVIYSYATVSVTTDSPSLSYLGGLVGYMEDDCSVTDSHATGSVTDNSNSPTTSSAGGLVGNMNGSGSITNSYATGAVTSNAPHTAVGGLVGSMGDNNIIKNSYAIGSVIVSSSADYSSFLSVGGLVGSMGASMSGGSIIDSYATGSVTSTANAAYSSSSSAGGLVGDMYLGSITDSYATGVVTSTASADASYSSASSAGGLVGAIVGSTITNSYATGSVTSNAYESYAGGLLGTISTDMIRSASITNCVAANPKIEIKQGTEKYMGRIVGGDVWGSSNTISNNFALDTMETVGDGIDYSLGDSGVGKGAAALQNSATYESLGWLFGDDDTHPWKMPTDSEYKYPILYWQ